MHRRDGGGGGRPCFRDGRGGAWRALVYVCTAV